MWHEFSVKEDMGEAVAEIPAPPGRAVYNRAELRVTQQEPLRATKTVNFGNVVILNEPVEVRVEPPGGDSSPAPSSKPKQSPSKRAASIYTSSGSKIFKRKPRQPAPVQPPSVLDFDDREVFGQPPLPVPDWMLAKPAPYTSAESRAVDASEAAERARVAEEQSKLKRDAIAERWRQRKLHEAMSTDKETIPVITPRSPGYREGPVLSPVKNHLVVERPSPIRRDATARSPARDTATATATAPANAALPASAGPSGKKSIAPIVKAPKPAPAPSSALETSGTTSPPAGEDWIGQGKEASPPPPPPRPRGPPPRPSPPPRDSPIDLEASVPRASRLMASPSSAPTPSPGAEPPQAGWLTLSSLAEGAPTPEPSADSAAELTTKVSPSRPSPRPAQLASATTSSPVSRRPVKPAGNGPSPQHARAQRAGVTRLATVPEGATSVHAGDAALSTSLPSVAVPRGAVPPPKPHSTLSATAPVPSASTGGTTVSPVKVPAVSVRLPAKPAPSSRPLNATARSTASSTMNSTAPRRGSVPAEGQRAYRRPRRSIFDEYSVNATMSVDSLEDRVGSMAFTYDCDLDRDRPRRQAAERRHSLGSSRSPGSGSLRTGVDSATVGTGTVSASVDDNNSSGKGHRHRRHRRHRRHHRSHSGSAGDASSQPGGDGSGAPESPRRHKRKHHHRHRRHHSSGSGAQGEDPQQPSSVSIVSDDKPEATAACVDIADVKAPPPPLPPADVGHFSRSVPKVGEVGDEVDEDDEEDMMSVLSEGGEKEQKSRQASAANSVAEELDALYELEY